ncbi:MAG: hypothetical protein IIU04_08300 [Bacteroidales bacterium]|nr:hypothetical protein [Bacteroidales bacterium]
MKKVVLTLAVMATVACFASCKKTCNCKTYDATGKVVNEEEVDLADGKDKCADMTTAVSVGEVKVGLVCE